MKKIGLYIHIPFCIKKCNYCDFNSYSNLDSIKEEYVKALIKEMQHYQGLLGDTQVETIYIGGGTPTCLSEDLLATLMDNCMKFFRVSDDCEISIEANPGTLSSIKLKTLKDKGVNRLSIGLQSWNEKELKRLGRIHTREQFIENLLLARQEGFNNINVDLMFSLPEQNVDTWLTTLENVIKLGVEHISCYGLKIEEGTPFYDDYENKRFSLPEDEVDREMYHAAIGLLQHNGYHHYEISNFAKPGFECRHNYIYWKTKEYIGLGAGAHSYWNSKRYFNTSSPKQYIDKLLRGTLPVEEEIFIDNKEKMSEFMFLGLRLIEGISCREFEQRFYLELTSVFGDSLVKMESLGLIEHKGDIYKLTSKGIDLSNVVFAEFV